GGSIAAGPACRAKVASIWPVKVPAMDYGLVARRGKSEGEMPIVNRVAHLHGEITAWRHDLHAHPELLYDVHRTAATVAEKLKAFGCDEVVTGIGRTRVVGVLRGRKPASGQ